MRNIKNITSSLSIAAISLVSFGSHAATNLNTEKNKNAEQDKWQFEGSILGYSETSRVSALEAIFAAKYQIDTDQSWSGKFTLDALTGSSPNGAIETSKDQVFTSASGNSHTVTQGSMPDTPGFKDTRVAINTNWQKRLSSEVDMTLGFNISNEYDYRSLGISGLFAFDTNNKNTTYSIGGAFNDDTIDPVGGVRKGLALMTNAGTAQPVVGSTEKKTTMDAIFGVSQVIDKNSLFQLNYSYSRSSGYHTDPYKVVSIVDPNTGVVVEQDPLTNLSKVIYENRPDTRTQNAFYGLYKTTVQEKDVFEISYRFMTDDWAINSHTIDSRYRFKFGKSFLRPHLRYYQQSKADFFEVFVKDGAEPTNNKSQFISADYRLGDLVTYTIGLEYGRDVSTPWSVALEYYLQQPKEPSGKFGDLQNRTLLKDVDAIMVRALYKF